MVIILLIVSYRVYTSFSCVKLRVRSKGMRTNSMAVGKTEDEHMVTRKRRPPHLYMELDSMERVVVGKVSTLHAEHK